MIGGSKYLSDVIKKSFNKELMMTKKDNGDFENYTKCFICDHDCTDSDVKVRDQSYHWKI